MRLLGRNGWLRGVLLLGAATLLLLGCGGNPTDPNFPEEPRVPPDSTDTADFMDRR